MGLLDFHSVFFRFELYVAVPRGYTFGVFTFGNVLVRGNGGVKAYDDVWTHQFSPQLLARILRIYSEGHPPSPTMGYSQRTTIFSGSRF